MRNRPRIVVLASAILVFVALSRDTDPLDGAPAPVPRDRREVKNSVGMRFALVPAGKFLMGSAKGEKYHHDSEEPRHEVEITRPFYLGVYEVTQSQYQKVMGKNPSAFSDRATGRLTERLKGLDTDNFPVEMVSWHEARQFCVKLASLPGEKKAGRAYRLPTEAEWEYACRAGTKTPFHYGDTLSCKDANFNDRYHDPGDAGRLGTHLRRPTTVGSYEPNAFGLYDMHGNVAEWCEDRAKRHYYKDAPKKDPGGPREEPGREELRIFRGGSYYDPIWFCRSAARNDDEPKYRSANLGVRIVCVAPYTRR